MAEPQSDIWQQGGEADKNLLPFMTAKHFKEAVREDMRRVYRVINGRRILVAVFEHPEDAKSAVDAHNIVAQRIESMNRDLNDLIVRLGDPQV